MWTRPVVYLWCGLVATGLSGCDIKRPNFLDPSDGAMVDNGPGPDGAIPPVRSFQVRVGTTSSAGGGTVRSADHAARLIISSPLPSGQVESADHRATLGTRPILPAPQP